MVLQLEQIIVQDLADSILESTSAGAVDSVSPLPATTELERNNSIASTSPFCSTTSEPATASKSSTIQNCIQIPKKLTVVNTKQGRKKSMLLFSHGHRSRTP